MKHGAHLSLVVVAALFALGACAEPVTKPAPDVATPAADAAPTPDTADAPNALPQVVYYKISPS